VSPDSRACGNSNLAVWVEVLSQAVQPPNVVTATNARPKPSVIGDEKRVKRIARYYDEEKRDAEKHAESIQRSAVSQQIQCADEVKMGKTARTEGNMQANANEIIATTRFFLPESRCDSQ
jgi:hypothetical protein